MKRRDFVARCGQAALGLTALPFAGCVTAASAAASVNAPPDPRLAELERQIPQWMTQHRVPGLSLALIRDARIMWRRAFGVRERERNAPVDVDTIFQACSMTKPVFSYLVLKLVEDGVLKLDTPLSRYSSTPFLTGDARVDQITARHVLSHTSGFQDARAGDAPLKIHFPPGERFLYSGEGYFWLQNIVTALTGGRVDSNDCAEFEAGLRVCATDFDALMRRRVLQPLGMNASGFVASEAIEARAARPHDAEGRAMRYHRPTAVAVARYGAMGGLLTTPTDYAKFMIAVMAPPAANEFLLQPASLTEMIRPQIKIETSGDQTVSWGLGWKLTHGKTGVLVEHGGENPGFECVNQWSPQTRSGYVVMTNAMNGQIFTQLMPALTSWITAPAT